MLSTLPCWLPFAMSNGVNENTRTKGYPSMLSTLTFRARCPPQKKLLGLRTKGFDLTDAPTLTFTEPPSEEHLATVWKIKDRSLAPPDAPTLAINESFNGVRNHKDERLPFARANAVDLNFSGSRPLCKKHSEI